MGEYWKYIPPNAYFIRVIGSEKTYMHRTPEGKYYLKEGANCAHVWGGLRGKWFIEDWEKENKRHTYLELVPITDIFKQ